jgi:hypothetical protein
VVKNIIKQEDMNWGKSIVVVFVAFALFIGTLVTVCVRQDVSLVAPDYYKQELDYQNQIERLQNAAALSSKPAITVSSNQLQVSYVNFSQVEKGELKLFRPSDAKLDKTFSLQATNNSIQTFDITAQQSGMYKASIRWTMDGKEYFMEETIYLN